MALNRSSLNRRLFMTAAAGVALLIAYAGYRTLRPGAGRFFGDFFYPYLAVARFAGDQVSNRSLLAYSRPELAAQVEKLMAVNRRLSAEAAEAKEFEEDNLQLRRLLKLDPPAAWRYVAAEVILRDPVLWNEHFTIDRGSRDGLTKGSAVISVTPDGRPILVGILENVGARTSEVRTLFSPGLRLSAALGTTGITGIVNAGERQPTSDHVPIGYLPSHLAYTLQEALFTTGYESGIPQGLKIGELSAVEEVNPRYSNALHLSGLLKPAAQLNSIRFLLIAERVRPPAGAGGGR